MEVIDSESGDFAGIVAKDNCFGRDASNSFDAFGGDHDFNDTFHLPSQP